LLQFLLCRSHVGRELSVTKAPSIAIVGGSLAGLATAAALAQFGFEAEMFEGAQSLGEIGAGINVSPQAI
jgi:salicylate hydroxylase